MPRGILLDIEGTTTPISFVYDVLFPFARAHVEEHLAEEDSTPFRTEYEADLANGLRPPLWTRGGLPYVYWLMDQDRKSTALKSLQGRIWQKGYENGELRGQVFPDVPSAFERWHRQGIEIRIYSSGSILAQRLLFATTEAGDLTRFLDGYFDTTTGPKTQESSYTTIGRAFNFTAAEILFISDIVPELDAAGRAGMETALCIRPGNAKQPSHSHRTISTFNEF